MKRIVMLFIFAVLFAAVVPVVAAESAESDFAEWDGRSLPPKDSGTYAVSRKLYLRGDVEIPKGVEIVVQSGAELVFPTGTRVNLSGKLTVEQGGRLFASGAFAAGADSVIIIGGEMLGSLNSRVELLGNTRVLAGGTLRTSGTLNLHVNAQLNNAGEMRVLSSSVATFSGKYIDAVGGRLLVGGRVNVTLSGGITANGNLTVSRDGRLFNSGRIIFNAGAAYVNLGLVYNTVSGTMWDPSDSVLPKDSARPPRELLTPQVIGLEPETFIRGIDVSFWQGDIDWAAVASTDIEFVMMRAGRGAFTRISDGEYFPIAEDERFREYIAEAQSHGLEVGVYFYSYARTVEQIRKEAKFLVDLLAEFQITYPVALDMEESRSYYTDSPGEMMVAFLEIVMDAGYFPMMYSYKSWLENNINAEQREMYSVWVAHIDIPATTYRGTYYMWQYTFTGRVSGIRGNVDLNIAYRDFAEYIRRNGLNNLRG